MDNKDYNNHIVPCCTKTVTYSMDTSVPSYKVETKVEACNVPDCPSKNRGLCMIVSFLKFIFYFILLFSYKYGMKLNVNLLLY